jgi:cell division protein FtsW
MVKMNIIDLSNFIEPFQMSRITNCNNSGSDLQGEGYQVFHSKIAISSGGIFGQGYGASKEKLGWLPECHTDFIFSVIAEEMGFYGCLIIIMLFLFLFYRGTYIASKSPTLYGRLLAFGITISVTMQAFFNISVATSFLPATGITLPFISYGGSSLFVTMCMMGILLNISKTQLRRVVSST